MNKQINRFLNIIFLKLEIQDNNRILLYCNVMVNAYKRNRTSYNTSRCTIALLTLLHILLYVYVNVNVWSRNVTAH